MSLQLSQCPKASPLRQHQQNDPTVRYAKKKVELISKQRTLPCKRGFDCSFSIYQTSQQQSSLHTDTRCRKLFSTWPLLITVTPGWKWADQQIKPVSFSSWFISQEMESSSSPPPSAPSKHRQRGVSSTGYSHLSRDEKAASVSSLLIMQPLRPEVKGCFVMAHRDQGGFCLTPQVLQPKIKMKLQDKWLHWNRLSPGKFLHCWDDLTLLICSFMSWEEEERALQTRLQMQNSNTKFVFLNTALRSQNYTLLWTWNTKALNPPHKSLLKSISFFFFSFSHSSLQQGGF